MNSYRKAYGIIFWILLLQLFFFLSSFFLSKIGGVSLALTPQFSVVQHQPWTLFTFFFLPNPTPFGFLFDCLWLLYFGVLLKDFRQDWFIGLAYLISIVFYALFAFGMTLLFPDLPISSLWNHPIYGGMIGNFTILAMVGIQIPHFRIPLFLLGPVAVKWLVFAYAILGILFSEGTLFFPYLIGFFAALLFMKTDFLYSITHFFQLNLSRPLSRRKNPIQDMEEEVNRILDKIARKGIKSLTRRERKFLDRYRQYMDSK
jgi:hypothetical protein